MKVYLAARYSTKEQVKICAAELRDYNIEVTSRWLEEPHSPTTQLNELTDQLNSDYAFTDLIDVARADRLVFFSVDPLIPVPRGGRHVEFGYALALQKPILVVGPKENIFHYLPSVHSVNTWPEAVKYLLERK